MRQRKRANMEIAESGKQLLVRTVVCVYYETTWQGINTKGYASEVKRELQQVFSYASPQGQMESTKFLKLMKVLLKALQRVVLR